MTLLPQPGVHETPIASEIDRTMRAAYDPARWGATRGEVRATPPLFRAGLRSGAVGDERKWMPTNASDNPSISGWR
jgi:hypothetical protein